MVLLIHREAAGISLAEESNTCATPGGPGLPPGPPADLCAVYSHWARRAALRGRGGAASAAVARAPTRRRGRYDTPPCERRLSAMPKPRSTPPRRRTRGVRSGSPPPPWSMVLQQALRAREAGAWQEVGRLLTLLDTAPDRPPLDSPSHGVQTWYTLQAHYWEHRAQYWQARARTAEAAAADIALVRVVAHEALQTLVRRVLEALDAAGAPNPSVPEVCRELLKDLEAVPWDTLMKEEERARAARRAGVEADDTPGAVP